jgi:hypothetical protein
MVGPDPDVVERQLRAGELDCPGCGGELRPWGQVWRWLREWGGDRRAERRACRRRGRCRACRATHVLQPVTTLGRRLDLAEVIGQALQAHVAGRGQRRIAIELGRPRATVVGWLRRFADRAEPLRVHFTRLAHELDPELAPVQPHGQPAADALEAIGVAARAAARCFGPAPPWWVAAGASGGWLLGVLAPTGPGGRNTSASLPAPG